jgi:hypothetical protein
MTKKWTATRSGIQPKRLASKRARRIPKAALAELREATIEAERVEALLVGWQPIRTAPRDGTWVILYDPAFKGEMPVSVGSYMTADDRDTKGRFKRGDWHLFEWDGLPSFSSPTHWMPLPAPPPKADR